MKRTLLLVALAASPFRWDVVRASLIHRHL